MFGDIENLVYGDPAWGLKSLIVGGIQHQEGDREPFAQGSLGILKDRAANDGEAIALASTTFRALANPVERTMRDVEDFLVPTLGALNAVRPAPSYQIALAGILVGKHFEVFFERDNNEIAKSKCGVNWGKVPITFAFAQMAAGDNSYRATQPDEPPQLAYP